MFCYDNDDEKSKTKRSYFKTIVFIIFVISLTIVNDNPLLTIVNNNPSLMIVNEKLLLTIVNKDLTLTILNDDPSLTIVNIIVNKKISKTIVFLKKIVKKTVANRFNKNNCFQKRSLFVF